MSLDGTLGKKAQQQRTILFVFMAVALAFTVSGLLAKWGDGPDAAVLVIIFMTIIPIEVGTMIALLCKQVLPMWYVVLCLYYVAFIMFMTDLNSRTMGSTSWPLIVVVIDLLLVMQAPARSALGLVGVTCVWLVVMGFEESFRFGLLDLPGFRPQEGPGGRREHFDAMTGCERLPCPMKFPPKGLIPALFVFTIDFVVTRWFAREALKEQQSMERTIDVVQEIASLLAGYDVEQVATLLETHEARLPQGMYTALRALEENLRTYKAYLPRTCLPFEVGSEGDVPDKVSLNESSSVVTVLSYRTERTAFTCSCPLLSRKATLLTLNIKQTLQRLETHTTPFCELFTSLLLKTLEASSKKGGMVDVFVGDRVHCSFNASRRCNTHASAALHVATALLHKGSDFAAHVNSGVATGQVLCGDMGCEVMRRFSMVGTLVRDVHGMERAGRVFGCAVLCNRFCFSDAECEHPLRLIPCKVEVDRGCEAEVVAELLVADTPKGRAERREEWMYVIGGRTHWEDYNETVKLYLKGEASEHSVATAARRGAGAGAGGTASTPLTVSAPFAKDNVLALPMRIPQQASPLHYSSHSSPPT